MSKPAAGPRLSDRQRLSWLRLIRTQNVGPASFRELINRFGSAETALEMLPELMISGGARKTVRIPSIAEAEAELEAAGENGARFVGLADADKAGAVLPGRLQFRFGFLDGGNAHDPFGAARNH